MLFLRVAIDLLLEPAWHGLVGIARQSGKVAYDSREHSSTAISSNDHEMKRGRGRPRKNVSLINPDTRRVQVTREDVSSDVVDQSPTKKSRGRPRKSQRSPLRDAEVRLQQASDQASPTDSTQHMSKNSQIESSAHSSDSNAARLSAANVNNSSNYPVDMEHSVTLRSSDVLLSTESGAEAPSTILPTDMKTATSQLHIHGNRQKTAARDIPETSATTIHGRGNGNSISDTSDSSKEKALKLETSFSIAALQRQNIILSLLEAHQGIMEGGLALVAPFQAEWQNITSSKIDRRTLGRDVNSLLEKKKIQQMCVSTMDDRGYPATKWILVSPEIDLNSNEVLQFQRDLVAREKSKGRNHERKQLEVISHDFSFYHIKPVQTKREIAKLQKKAEQAMRAAQLTEEQQHAATEKLKKRMEERHNRKVAAKKTDIMSFDAASVQRTQSNSLDIAAEDLIRKQAQRLSSTSAENALKRKRRLQSDDPLAAYARPGKKPRSEQTEIRRQRQDASRVGGLYIHIRHLRMTTNKF